MLTMHAHSSLLSCYVLALMRLLINYGSRYFVTHTLANKNTVTKHATVPRDYTD